MNGWKKLLAMLLCAAMCISMLPTWSFAEGETGAEIDSGIIEAAGLPDGTNPEEAGELQHEHAYVPTVIAPSCTEQGYTVFTCECGDSYISDYTDALNHPEIHEIAEVPATCTTDGVTAGKRCAVCGETVEGFETIPATGHIPIEVAEVPATTESTGTTAGTKCAVCGEILSGCEEIPMPEPVEQVFLQPNEPSAEEQNIQEQTVFPEQTEESWEQDWETPAEEGSGTDDPLSGEQTENGQTQENGITQASDASLVNSQEQTTVLSETDETENSRITGLGSESADKDAQSTLAKGEEQPLYGEGSVGYVPGGTEDDGSLLNHYASKELGLEAPKLRGPLNPTSGFTPAQIEIYNTLKTMICETAAGTRSSTVYEVSFSNPDLAVLTVTEPISEENYQNLAGAAFNQDMGVEKVFNALLAVCPYELYWFDKTCKSPNAIMVGYSFSCLPGETTITITDLTYRFVVSQDYSPNGASGGYAVDASYGVQVSTAVSNAHSIVDTCTVSGDYGRLLYYKDRICDAVTYNTAAAGGGIPYGNPWQIVWVFDSDPTTKVVCEGYAKAFQYLCDLTQEKGSFASPLVNCYCVTGKMNGGNHMWNIVTMDDGVNYLVDVTNCDEGAYGAPDLLFLRGYTGTIDGGYVFLDISYVYDSDTVNSFSTAELTVSSADYGASADPFIQLKAACASGTDYFSLENLESLTVRENLTIPQGMQVNLSGTTLIVPAGVTLTDNGILWVSTIENNGSVTIGANAEMDVDTMLMGNGLLIGMAENSSIVLSANIDPTTINYQLNGGKLTLHTQVHTDDALVSWMQEAEANAYNPDYDYLYEVLEPLTVTADMTVPQNTRLYVISADVEWGSFSGALTVPAGRTLTVLGELSVQNAKLTVQGMLCNPYDEAAGWAGLINLEKAYEWYGDCGVIILASQGVYTGSGTIRVADQNNPKSYLEGFSPESLVIIGEDAGSTILRYTPAPVLTEAFNSATGVRVSWNPVTGAAKYRLLRKNLTKGETAWKNVGETTECSLIDKTVASASRYTFTVECIDTAGNTCSGRDETGRTCTYIAKADITELKAVSGGVSITWSKPAGAKNFRVMRRTDGTNSWTVIAVVEGTSYTDTTAPKGVKLWYTVRGVSMDNKVLINSYNGTGWSLYHVNPPVMTEAFNSATGVRVSWNPVMGAAKYRLLRKNVTAGETSWTAIGETKELTLIDKSAVSAQRYTYTVECIDANGRTSSAQNATGRTCTYIAMAKITGIKGVTNGVSLTWSKPAGAKNFRVFRKVDGSSTWTAIKDIQGTTWTDTSAQKNVKYWYTVRAITLAGDMYINSYNATGWSVTRK